MNKDYLGDSVYAEATDLGEIVLTTENGFGASNKIIMERPVLEALIRFAQRHGVIERAEKVGA